MNSLVCRPRTGFGRTPTLQTQNHGAFWLRIVQRILYGYPMLTSMLDVCMCRTGVRTNPVLVINKNESKYISYGCHELQQTHNSKDATTTHNCTHPE